MNRIFYSVVFASQKVPQHKIMILEGKRTEGQPYQITKEPHQILTIRMSNFNTDEGNKFEIFNNSSATQYIIIRLLKNNINPLNLTFSMYYVVMYLEVKGRISEEFTQLFKNRLDDAVQSCTMQNNSKSGIIVWLTNKNNRMKALTFSILNRGIMILCDWLRTVKSDSSTGGACNSVLEMLKWREKISILNKVGWDIHQHHVFYYHCCWKYVFAFIAFTFYYYIERMQRLYNDIVYNRIMRALCSGLVGWSKLLSLFLPHYCSLCLLLAKLWKHYSIYVTSTATSTERDRNQGLLRNSQHDRVKMKPKQAVYSCTSTTIFSKVLLILCLCVETVQSANSVVDLATFNSGSLGYKLLGENGHASSMSSVASVGDVNADGIGDFAIGAPTGDPLSRTDAGIVHVIFGRTGLVTAAADLLTYSSGSAGFRIFGAAAGDYCGYSFSSAGDVNHDGIDDLIVGCVLADPLSRANAGMVYVIFGHSMSTAFTDLDLASFTSGVMGFKILGAALGDSLGVSVSSAGDFNGDGIDDVIVGADGADPFSRTDAGTAYIVYGRTTVTAFTDIDLNTLTSGATTWGMRIAGAASGDQCGRSVRGAGDVNNDGIDDVVFGCIYADPLSRSDAGSAYIIYGKSTGLTNIDLVSFVSSGYGGRVLYGAVAGDQFGFSVSGAGDINGDGIADVVVGAPGFDLVGRINAGITYVVFGASSSTVLTTDMASFVSGSTGFKILGAVAGDSSGYSVSRAGDVNADGFNDVIVGARSADPNGRTDAGAAYIIYGHSYSSPFINIDLATAVWGYDGVKILGRVATSYTGNSVGGGGDFNGDGVSDVLVGAYNEAISGRAVNGAVYLLYGAPTTPSDGTTCLSGWSKYQGKCYYFGNYQYNWDNCKNYCGTLQNGASMLCIENADQNAYIYSRVYGDTYIGYRSNPGTAYNYYWVPGCTSTYTNWNPTEPNNSGGIEFYASIYGLNGRWNDVSNIVLYCACEMKSLTAAPTTAPSRFPSLQPSSQPSRQPTGQPSTQPISRPSAQPSSQPSFIPSCQPSVQPTSSPTDQPTAIPSTLPSVQPTCKPSSFPSSQPSDVSSSQPSAVPTDHPSSQPTCQPSSLPSSQPSAVPSTQPSAVPSATPSAVPSSRPSSQPTSQPTGYPSGQPSVFPSGQPSTQPSAAPTTQSVGLSILSLASTRTAIQVVVQAEWSGSLGAYVYCAALLGIQTQLTALTDIYRYNQMVFASSSVSVVSMNFTSLLPSTAYSVYCTAKSVQGLEISLQEAQQTAQYVRTKCCKEVVVTVLQPSVVSGAFVSKVVAIKLSSPPSLAAPSLQLSVSYTAQTGAIGSVSAQPSVFTFSASRALQSEYSAAVVASAGAAGTFTLTAELTGSAVADYTIVYAGSRTVTVRAVGTVPPIPRVQKAQFSNSGSSITVSFDSPTDQRGLFGIFACTKLLSFAGANVAMCQWRDAAVLHLYPVYSTVVDTVQVGSNITVLGNVIKAKCVVVPGSPCAGWFSLQHTTVVVQPPVAATTPSVVMSVPIAIGGCSPMLIDLANSAGGSGRPWSSVRFTVKTQGSGVTTTALQLERFLTYNYTLNPPTPVPYTAFEKDRTYLIQATLCNFLGACATANSEVAVAAMGTVVPVVSILGQSVRAVYRPEPFSISASAYMQSCGSPPSTAALVYVWTTRMRLTGDTVFNDVTVSSTSQNPTIYKLPAFSLTVSAEYQITLSVLSTVYGVRSTAPVLVSVQTSALTAVISGGSPRYVVVGDTVVLDASKSYDADYPSTSAQNAGLFFQWECVQTAPVFASSCALALPQTLNTSKLSVSVTHLALNTTYELSVTVYDATRRSMAQTSVVVVGAPRPKLAITNSLSSMTNIITGTQFVLFGTLTLLKPCTAVWSVDNPSVLLSYAALTPVGQSLAPLGREPVVFNLVLKPASLPQRSQLTFSLTCDNTIATAVVTTNGAPLPGDFTVTPASGMELSTPYVFAALQWTDPDLPLTYQFGFESAVSLSNLVIVAKSELTYTQSTLPAGSALSGYRVNASLLAFDSYGAFAAMWRSLVVNPSPPEQQLDILKEFILTDVDTVDGLKQKVSVGSAVLNSVNCSMVTNCTHLNRHPCQRTSGECGGCLPGYMGDAGDRSTQCMPRTTAAEPKQCTTATQCALWESCNADSGSCVVMSKSCSRNCSDHGSCVFFDSITGVELQQCSLSNAGCEAACSCTDGYSGQFCEITPSDLRSKRDLRSSLVNSLYNLTKADDINVESVSAWSASLYSLSIKPHEVSLEDLHALSGLANATLANALELKVVTPELIAGVLQATDTVTTLQYNYDPSAERNTSYTFPNNTAAAILHTLGGYGDLVVSNMVLGENHTEVLYNNFGMSTHKVSVTSGASNITLTTSQFASGMDGQVSTVMLTPGNTSAVAGVKLLSVPPRLFTSNTTAFVSVPITLQLQQTEASEVLMSDAVSFISFAFQHIELQLQYLDGSGGNFTSQCTEGQNASHVTTYICPGSGHVFNHNCSQGPGTHVSYCPRPSPVCTRLDTKTAAVTHPQACRVVTYTPTSTVCECSVYITDNAQRRLSTEEDVMQLLDESGATSMMVSTTYIASSFVNTFNAAEGLNNGSAEDVYVVASILGGLWTIGVLVLVGHWVREWTSDSEDSSSSSSSVKPDEQTDALKSVLEYVHQTVPAVFSDNDHWTQRLWQEIVDHHMLFALFQGHDVWDRLKVVFTTLTEQTFMLFLVAVFFDVSVPSNDNSCEPHQTEVSCLRRVSPFDHSQTYCKWNAASEQCSYNSQDISFEAIFYLSILTTVITSIATLPIEYMFATLNAPTATSLKGSKVAAIVDTVVNGARKLSKIAGAKTTNNRDSLRRKSILSSIISEPDSVIANREISAELSEVANRARKSIVEIQSRATLHLTRLEAADRKLRDASARRSSLSASPKSPNKDSIRLTEHASINTLQQVSDYSGNSKRNISTLQVDVIQQRLLMNDAAKETVVYDAQWGVCISTEEFSISQYTINPVAEKAITEAVQEAQDKSEELLESLSNYSVHHAGLEILHLFMMDLLGRTTPAAKIFQEKFGEEFSHSRVVVLGQKIVAIVMIVLLNAFFMYYILLKGFQKGRTWQRQFLYCSLAQWVVDMFIFETAECVWLNFTVPRFVCQEVVIAAKKLIQVTERLTGSCDDLEQQQYSAETKRFFLNAPAHLFVSIRLAKSLPQLMESTIVSNYTHHLPGEICKTWPHCAEQQEQGSQPCIGWVVFPRSLLRGVLLAVQVVISGSYTYQRIVLRFGLPVLFSGICTMVYTVVKNETEFIVLGVVLGLAVVYSMWSLYITKCSSHHDVRAVAPECSAAVDVGIPTFQLQETEEDDQDSSASDSTSVEENQEAAVVSEPYCAVMHYDAGEGDQGAAATVVSEPHIAVLDYYAGEGDQGTAATVVSEPHSAVLDYYAGEGDEEAATTVVSEPHRAVLDYYAGEGDQEAATTVVSELKCIISVDGTKHEVVSAVKPDSKAAAPLKPPVQTVRGTRNPHSNKWSLKFD